MFVYVSVKCKWQIAIQSKLWEIVVYKKKKSLYRLKNEQVNTDAVAYYDWAVDAAYTTAVAVVVLYFIVCDVVVPLIYVLLPV